MSRPGSPKSKLASNPGKQKSSLRGNKSPSPSKKLVVTYDLEVEPEDLIPEYLSAKASLLKLSRSSKSKDGNTDREMEVAKLEAKLSKIEKDVLFDKFVAEAKWKAERIAIERQLALAKKDARVAADEVEVNAEEPPNQPTSSLSEVNEEAERIAKEVLAQRDEDSLDGDDDDIAGLFASLPQNEVDPSTGKTQTVINTADGTKLVLRDFGKWTGLSPRQILDEACRSRYIIQLPVPQCKAPFRLTEPFYRDASVRFQYTVVSDATFASQHSLSIEWKKPQDLPQSLETTDLRIDLEPMTFTFTMTGVATSNSKQSEAYVSTVALFHIFSGSPKDEKVNLRLPAVWKDLWTEMVESKKTFLDSQDRESVRSLRTLVRRRQDQELEDGVIAFRGRGAAKLSPDMPENGSSDRSRLSAANAEVLKRVWADKADNSRFQSMLVKSFPFSPTPMSY